VFLLVYAHSDGDCVVIKEFVAALSAAAFNQTKMKTKDDVDASLVSGLGKWVAAEPGGELICRASVQLPLPCASGARTWWRYVT